MKNQNGKSEDILELEVTEDEITQLAQEELDNLPGGPEEKREQVRLLAEKVAERKRGLG